MTKVKVQAETRDFFDKGNIVRDMYEKVESPKGNAGQVAILKPTFVKETFTKEYRVPEYQLFRLECGFGVHPDCSGNACYGHFCADGEWCRMEKYNFLGIADEKTTKYAEELENAWKKKHVSAV